MRRPIMAIACAVFMVGTIFITVVAPAAPTPQITGTEVIGARTWTTDIRVTRNGANDHIPQVTVDADHDAHIFWQSARSPNPGYYYVKLNRQGELLSQEMFITSRVYTSWGPQYPYGPNIAIDSQESLHVVYDCPDYGNVCYQKLDAQGNLLVAEKKIGVAGCSSCHTATVAVGLDDTVHIANENYKFQCEDIVYHKLDNAGNEIWTNRVVSSDVATHCEFDLVKASRYSGNFLFTFGSSTGTWLGRMDKFGVKTMSSVKVRPEMDYKIADVAETPNGDMHVVWFDPTVGGKIHYTRVNATGVKVNDNVIISPNAVSAGMPRVAATSTGEAVVVWEDQRNGNFDIYYAVITPSLFHDASMDIPENVRLTSQQDSQRDPWIAIDPDDNYHVVWTDKRDGNEEIYYKFMFNFALELSADPIDLANMYFIHPNETKRLTLNVRNKGGLLDSYLLDLSYSFGAAQTGWRVELDQTYIESLEAGEISKLNLTVRAPPTAREGESVTIRINASSVTAPSSWDDVVILTTVRVTRSLRLDIGTSVKIGDNGETLAFNVIASNTGDVRENDISILPGVGLAPPGWVVWSDVDRLNLDSKETTNFTVFVHVPEDTSLAPANFLARIGISIRSSADTAVIATKDLTVQVKANFVIQMTPDFDRQYADPGDLVHYTISVSNLGNLAGQAQINVESQKPPQPGWEASLDKETVYLRGGETTTVQLTVHIPQNALAASHLTLVVSALAIKFGVTGNTEVSTFVNTVYGLDFQVGSSPDIRVGKTATFPVTVTNTGNGDETLTLAPALLEPDWNMTFSVNNAEVNSVFVPHGESRTFNTLVQTSNSAGAGLHTPVAAVIDQALGQHMLPLPVKVVQFFGVELTATEFKLSGSPSRTLEYNLELRNVGNGPDSFTLSVEDLAAEVWMAKFQELQIRPNPANPLINDEVFVDTDVVSLLAHDTTTMRLLITVPRDTTSRQVQFTARATSASGEQDSLILVSDIKLADLKIDRADFSPTTAVPGQISAITVAVANVGDIEGAPVIVEFYDNGQLLATDQVSRIAQGQRGYVTFAWLPTPGEHSLRFVVDPSYLDDAGLLESRGHVIEVNEDDNTFTLVKPVGAQSSFLPGFDGALALAAVAAGGVVLTGLRRRRA